MNIVILSLIGALVILDKYAIGEFGISQPIISGLIFGAIFGRIPEGIFLGSVFQLIFLGGLPIGRDIPPDGQGAGLAGCGSYFLLRGSNTPETALLGAVILGLSISIIGGMLEIYFRKFNEKLYYNFMRNESCLITCHLAGLATAFLRGFILLLPVFFIAQVIILPKLALLTRELIMIIAVSIGVANGVYLFVKKNTIIYLVLGILCALVSFVF